MIAVTIGVGPGDLKTRCSKEGEAGMESGMVVKTCLWMTAMPPPRPSGRGELRYVYPEGVAWLSG